MAIIRNIDELKKCVKVNANTPFESIEPYIYDATDIYIAPFLGLQFLSEIEENQSESNIINLLPYIHRALAPLSLMLYALEGSINVGDSGHTVQKSDKLVPASDIKIEKMIENLSFRGFQAIDRMLTFLYANKDNYSNFKVPDKKNYLDNPKDFQEIGCIDIQYSRLTFESLRPIICSVEYMIIGDLISKELDCKLRNNTDKNDTFSVLYDMISKYVANQTAYLFTSIAARDQRMVSKTPEYKPVIRPLYSDVTDTGNYYAEIARSMRIRIVGFITEHAEELGESLSETFQNKIENKIFVA